MKNKVLSHVEAFISGESTAGLVLMAAGVFALIAANSALAPFYQAFLTQPVPLGLAPLALTKPALLWINDGLMAIFFLLVGLEIKREVVAGELSNRATAALPVIAAVGGMVGPAAVFLAFNFSSPANLPGWAIPTATDIAFALGVLTLLGSRVPASLKIFLTALAVIDDLCAIIIIAIFYTAELSALALGAAAAFITVLVILNRMGVRAPLVYLAIGVLLWISVLKSGVHATLAGVITGLAIPAIQDRADSSPLTRLEHALHPYVAFLILPIFAFANAGVSLVDATRASFFHPITLGIVFGLFLGKQAGVMTAVMIALRLGVARLPAGVTLRQLYGVAVLTGIGFTMSLFIGTLAFAPPLHTVEVKLGVLGGSLLSGVLGYIMLRSGPRLRQGPTT